MKNLNLGLRARLVNRGIFAFTALRATVRWSKFILGVLRGRYGRVGFPWNPIGVYRLGFYISQDLNLEAASQHPRPGEWHDLGAETLPEKGTVVCGHR